MKYLSLFSGIGGFELGIQHAYENIRRLHNSGETRIRERHDDTRDTKDLFQSSRRTASQDTGVNIKSGNPLPTKLNDLDNRPTRSQEQETHTKQDSANPPSKHSRQSTTCVGFSEIDKYATQIYQQHFPEHKNYGDITKIKAEDLPEFDLIVGGFPCQSFSIAGKRGGFNDTRGTMFFEIARILKAKQPRLLLLENVKGLLSHDEGRTFATIIATLDELGYDLQWQVLNSKNFGVPQNRERVFIIGHLRGTSRPQVFPIGESHAGNTESQGETRSKGQRIRGNIASTLAARDYKGGGNLIVKIAEATKKGYAEATVGQSINLSVPNSKTRRGRVSDIAQTLDTGMQQHTLTSDMKIRRLTPKECERLQGFPDGWTEGVSDTQRYKTLGNAVTTNAIQAIMEKLL